MKKSSIPDFSYQWNWQQCLVPWGLARAPPVWADLLIPRSLFDLAQMTSSLPHHHTWMISWHLQYNFQYWLGLCYMIYTLVFIHINVVYMIDIYIYHIYNIQNIPLKSPKLRPALVIQERMSNFRWHLRCKSHTWRPAAPWVFDLDRCSAKSLEIRNLYQIIHIYIYSILPYCMFIILPL